MRDLRVFVPAADGYEKFNAATNHEGEVKSLYKTILVTWFKVWSSATLALATKKPAVQLITRSTSINAILMPLLGDVIMIATMDRKHGMLKLTSLMRDLRVFVPAADGYEKFNAHQSYQTLYVYGSIQAPGHH